MRQTVCDMTRSFRRSLPRAQGSLLAGQPTSSSSAAAVRPCEHAYNKFFAADIAVTEKIVASSALVGRPARRGATSTRTPTTESGAIAVPAAATTRG